MTQENFTTPVGRLVQGDLYTANDKDADGNVKVYKSGPNLGKPRPEYYVALAIPKERDAAGQIQHWAHSAWGQLIWAAGHKFKPHASQMPAFAWKIRDGDSTVPNKKGRRPCDQEGFPGNWVVGFSSGFAPKIYTLIGQKEPVLIEQKDAVNLGDYVQINGNVDGNASDQQPGVFINLSMVCLAGYGQRIVVGPDVASAGFGGAPLPAGASMTPPAGFAPPPVAGSPLPPAIPGTPAVPGMAPPGALAPTYAPPGTAPSSIAPPPQMAPNPAFLAPPGVPSVPGVPGVPGVPPAGPQMTAAAGGASYADFIGKGWTDALLRQHGMML